jgi:biotin carboxyl carrier protein
MIQAVINGKTINVEHSREKVSLNGNEHFLDLVAVNNNKHLHILYNNHSYFIEIMDFDKATKTYKLSYNGNTFEVNIKDRFDQLLHNMGLDKIKKSKVNDIKAPMPGLVLSIKILQGTVVKKGDTILILEAMKMENVIKSPTDGIVKNINVVEKQPIEKNQVLVTFE